ncbi:serine-type D-Ala-D-Ala carboxypeptidase [Serratia sp. Lou2A]|uniref:serine-type D-Ala-D-Ala carboxypeptidase n=1 Tax=Serratia montpellierensis TaxID=2598730 RepID=A0ABS8JCR0_9GAMM|nr:MULTISPECIES: serine hydrolase [unclassified Serratia (in: enterobacteria)]MCC7582311.1 serine-type D-Ala-D-Ala carboxypeptidase [Serratia sp. Lou2A]MCC7661823.1 serine-type D-Ala-D-Ala carboxypeptidase [Serratia sp. Pon4B]
MRLFSCFNLKAIVFSLLTLSTLLRFVFASEMIPTPRPTVDAKSWILIDFDSGKVLAEGNADVKISPASLTKIMTSYVIGQAIKQRTINLEDKVSINRDAWVSGNPTLYGSSAMFLKLGERASVKDLNKGIVIQSGSDACIAMADYIAGNQSSFIKLMNAYAHNLGLNNTIFKTVHGLNDAGEFTTARDMAFLAKALIHDLPQEYALYKEKDFTYNNIHQYSKNKLLWNSDLNVDGLKTGTTSEEGFNIVASAAIDKMRLISVVLNAKNDYIRFQESEKLLAWGFRNFEKFEIKNEGSAFTSHRVWLGDKKFIELNIGNSSTILIPKGKIKDINVSYSIDNEKIIAPVKKGQQIGKATFKIGNSVIEERPLIAMETIDEGGVFSKVWDYLLMKINSWTGFCLSCEYK